MENIQPRMLRAKGIAQMFDVGITTVWEYAKKGYLTPNRITPGLTLFDVGEAKAFFQEKLHNHRSQSMKNEISKETINDLYLKAIKLNGFYETSYRGSLIELDNLVMQGEFDLSSLEIGRDYVVNTGISFTHYEAGYNTFNKLRMLKKGYETLVKTSEAFREFINDEWAEFVTFK